MDLLNELKIRRSSYLGPAFDQLRYPNNVSNLCACSSRLSDNFIQTFCPPFYPFGIRHFSKKFPYIRTGILLPQYYRGSYHSSSIHHAWSLEITPHHGVVLVARGHVPSLVEGKKESLHTQVVLMRCLRSCVGSYLITRIGGPCRRHSR
jgi:hypothetical protein